MSPSANDFVEIYRTDSQTEATRIVEVVLCPQGVQAVLHDRTDHSFPTPASQPGNYFVAVLAAERDRALALLDEYRTGLTEKS